MDWRVGNEGENHDRMTMQLGTTIMVMHDNPIVVPPSDIGTHLGFLLDHPQGTDVLFIVEGEKFPAHRAILAARSPVFRAELFGSMAESTMSSITLHEIKSATFRVMLRHIYTDALPEEGELGESPVEMFMDLLAAADRYALDRLKLMCAQKLWDNVSEDTAADIFACAEMHNCPELKNRCVEFSPREIQLKKQRVSRIELAIMREADYCLLGLDSMISAKTPR